MKIKIKKGKKIKWYFFICSISFIVIGIIICIIVYLTNKDDEKNKNEFEEEIYCLTFKVNGECKECNHRYELINGACIANYSFRIKYKTFKKYENINLISSNYIKNIIEIEIDKEQVIHTYNYTLNSPGYHTLYFTMNLED